MRIDAIAIGKNPPYDVNVVIEVPIGGEPIKYEMDKAAGALVVDRFLYTATMASFRTRSRATAILVTCSSRTPGRFFPARS